MAVQFAGGVVIGADSRTTTGSYIVGRALQTSLFKRSCTQANRVTDKLTHIHDRVYCCRSGSAADTQAVADAVHQHCQVYTSVYGHAPPVATVAALFEKLCYDNKDQLSAGIIVAGWDEEGGGVFNVPLGGGIFQQPWAIGGKHPFLFGFTTHTYMQDPDLHMYTDTVMLHIEKGGEKPRRSSLSRTVSRVHCLLFAGHTDAQHLHSPWPEMDRRVDVLECV